MKTLLFTFSKYVFLVARNREWIAGSQKHREVMEVSFCQIFGSRHKLIRIWLRAKDALWTHNVFMFLIPFVFKIWQSCFSSVCFSNFQFLFYHWLKVISIPVASCSVNMEDSMHAPEPVNYFNHHIGHIWIVSGSAKACYKWAFV